MVYNINLSLVRVTLESNRIPSHNCLIRSNVPSKRTPALGEEEMLIIVLILLKQRGNANI